MRFVIKIFNFTVAYFTYFFGDFAFFIRVSFVCYVISVFIVFTWRFLIIVSSPFLDDFMVFIYRLFDTVISRSAWPYGDPIPWYAFLTMLGSCCTYLYLFGHSLI